MRRLLWCVLLLATTAVAQQPPIRVRLMSLYHLKEVTISAEGPATARFSAAPESIRGAITVGAKGESVDFDGRLSRKVAIDGRIRVVGGSMRPMSVSVPLEITVSGGELRLIALFPVEDYVAAVLQGETAGDMPPEALKALAVAIRSYATRFRERHKEEHFDFCDSTHCQYLRTDVSARLQDAVAHTANELLWDRGSPLAAYYHKDCGGRTEDVAAVWPDQRSPALVSHEDPYCSRVAANWKSVLSREQIVGALARAKLQTPAKWNRITVSGLTSSGRVSTLEFRVGATQQSTTVSASSFRFALGRSLGWNTLKSDWYEVAGSGGQFMFTGRGVGHGVGLCQSGAAEMAKAGKSYRDILAFYYPGAAIGVSAQGLAWITRSGTTLDVRAVDAKDATRVLPVAEEAWSWAVTRSGLTMNGRATVDVFPTVEMFRNATGEPGWVAASTRGEHTRIQPPTVLGAKLHSLLRHEFLHMLVEKNSKADIPLWFREGFVLYLSGETRAGAANAMTANAINRAITARRDEASVKRAYDAATARVAALVQQYGQQELLRWLRSGIPSDIAVGPDKVAK